METLDKMKLGTSAKAEMASLYEQTFQNFDGAWSRRWNVSKKAGR